jgi:acyl-CoA thioesterase II
VATPLEELVELLDLEQIEVNLFRGVSPKDDRQRVFGGQVAGQALVAAGRTVARGTVHSLHAYFLRPGDPAVPIVYDVDRIRDGRSFTTRRVVAIQHGRAIFNLAASFHISEEGLDHQIAMPAVPGPDDLATSPHGPRSIDVRPVDVGGPGPRGRAWFRADGPLPEDPLLHACVVAFASDLTLLDTTLSAHGLHVWEAPGVMLASLDHAMWFHRAFRADEWLLYDQDSPVMTGARGFARGSIFTAEGRLAVSVVQEGLVRPLR